MSIDQLSKFEASMKKRQPGKTILTSQRKMIDAPTLAKRWNIPPDRAKTTFLVTTQRGVRHVTNPSIMRRLPTNDRMLRYNRLPHPFFTDTLLVGTASQRSHKFSQVFATSYGWSHTIPMTKKSDAPFALDRLFRHEGVPPEMIIDGSKEQNLGDFDRKLRDAGCHRKQIYPSSAWMNLCEGKIRELKRGSTREKLKRNFPKKLWDYCLELESRIRSANTLPRFDLDHQTPETKMHGMSSDISDICEFEFYE